MNRLAIALLAAISAVPAVAAPAAMTLHSGVGAAPAGAYRETLDAVAWSGTSGVTPLGIVLRTAGLGGWVVGHDWNHASPFISGLSGDGFGDAGGRQPSGPTMSAYLTAGAEAIDSASLVELRFPTRLRAFGLLWGSIDPYNRLTLFDGDDEIGFVDGAMVAPQPDGDQGESGTRYVNLSSSRPFDRVVATSGAWAFEFDNISFTPFVVPAPGAAALLGTAALALAGLRRRRTP